MVLISLFNSETKDQLESTNKFPDLEKKMDSIGLLNLKKKLVYTVGMNDLNTGSAVVLEANIQHYRIRGLKLIAMTDASRTKLINGI